MCVLISGEKKKRNEFGLVILMFEFLYWLLKCQMTLFAHSTFHCEMAKQVPMGDC